jgi:hypothetical protein
MPLSAYPIIPSWSYARQKLRFFTINSPFANALFLAQNDIFETIFLSNGSTLFIEKILLSKNPSPSLMISQFQPIR